MGELHDFCGPSDAAAQRTRGQDRPQLLRRGQIPVQRRVGSDDARPEVQCAGQVDDRPGRRGQQHSYLRRHVLGWQSDRVHPDSGPSASATARRASQSYERIRRAHEVNALQQGG
jgi:hypothetical protein